MIQSVMHNKGSLCTWSRSASIYISTTLQRWGNNHTGMLDSILKFLCACFCVFTCNFLFSDQKYFLPSLPFSLHIHDSWRNLSAVWASRSPHSSCHGGCWLSPTKWLVLDVPRLSTSPSLTRKASVECHMNYFLVYESTGEVFRLIPQSMLLTFN